MNNERWMFFSLVLFFILVRLIFIFFSPYSFFDEELKQVALGIELLNGKLTLPFWCYLDSPHSGGSLFTALLLIPFYLIVGKKFLALKIAALSYSVITFILIISLLRRYYPIKKLYFPFLLLFVFSTPHYLQKSVYLTGNTVEFLLVVFLFLWLIDGCLFQNKETKLSYLILGIVAGLGLWIQYLFSIFLFFFFIVWLWRRKLSIFKADLWHFVIGFTLGFSPWIIYNLIYGFPSIFSDQRIVNLLLNKNVRIFSLDFHKFKRIILEDLPRSFHFLSVGGLSPKLFAYIFYFLFWLAIILIVFSRSRRGGEKKIKYFWILLFIIAIGIHSFFSFPIGLKGSKWGSMNPYFEFYLLYIQVIMFVLFCIAYASVRQVFWGILFKGGLYIFLPVFIIQFFLTLRPFSLNKKILMNLSRYRPLCNAYETGFNFAVSPYVWEKVLKEIKDPELRENFLKGSAHSWKEVLKSPQPSLPLGYLYMELSKISEHERDIFLEYLGNEKDKIKIQINGKIR
jgi:hypothetical protein